jgi:hypothetical protein
VRTVDVHAIFASLMVVSQIKTGLLFQPLLA